MWAEQEKYKNHFLQLEIKHLEPKHINELVNNGEFDFHPNLIGLNLKLIGFRLAFASHAPAAVAHTNVRTKFSQLASCNADVSKKIPWHPWYSLSNRPNVPLRRHRIFHFAFL